MGLLQEITKTAGAINVYGQAVQAAGKNISNVQNPEYARQSVVIQDGGNYQTKNGIESFGISASTLTHARNKVLDDQIIRESMNKGSLDAQGTFTKNIEAYFGREVSGASDSESANSSGGLADAIDDYFKSFHSFNARPQEFSSKQTLLQDAGILVDQLHSLDSKLTTVDENIVSQTNSDVTDANTLLARIAGINQQIFQIEVSSDNDALDLRDRLQASLEELGELVNFEVQIIDGSHAGNIRIVAKDTLNNDVILVEKAQVLNSLAFNGTTIITAGSSPVDLTITGGNLHGNLYVRANTLTNVRNKLDALANQLVTSVNGAYNPTSSVNEDFFTAGNLTAANISLDSNLTVSTIKATNTTDQGASELARAVAELQNNVFSIGGGDQINGTFAQHFAQMTVDVGQDVSVVNKKIDSQDIVERALKARRSEFAGVTLDEEVADLISFEKVVGGLGHYLKIVSALYDSIISGFT